MNADQLRARVAAFERWHYAIDLGHGVVTPIFETAHVVRHEQRRQSFFSPLVTWLGGLDGLRVLDLGCNAGFWSLQVARAGAREIMGLDGRQTHVDQAELVMEACGVLKKQAHFRQADVTSTPLGRDWDLILCLGLLYHVDEPLELVSRLVQTEASVLVIDTEVHPSFGLRARRGSENLSDPRSSSVGAQIHVPTTRAIVQVLKAGGYSTVVIRPRFTDWLGSEDYRGGWRRTIVASRDRPLEGLRVEADVVGAPHRETVRWMRWAWSRLASRLFAY